MLKPLKAILSRGGRWLLILAGIASVVLLLAILAGYFREKVDSQTRESITSIPAGALFAPVMEVTQPRYESAVGAIKPVHEANVASKILARVLEIRASAGQRVLKGDVLARLSDDEQRSRVQPSEADRDSAVARFQLAQIEAERVRQLEQTNSASRAELDVAMTRLKTSQANLDRANRAVEEAKVYLDFATVVAPFSGVVVDKLVQTGDTVTPGQALLTLYDPTHMQLVANVRESLASRLEVGQMLPAQLESLGYECLATISEVVPKADVFSRSFEVKVSGPCPPGVYSGMFGRLMIPLDDEQLLLIPSSTVQRVGQLTMVQVLTDGQLVRRSVQLGRKVADQMEVLAGLRAGEQVLVPAPASKDAAP